MTEHEKIASAVFAQQGLSFRVAQRAGGWTNAVWLNGGFVLRVSRVKGANMIRREVERAKFLPEAVGYPLNIAVGVMDGYEWSLSERIKGKVLSGVWSGFSLEEKAEALKQVFNIMTAVHSVAVENVESFTLRRAWYSRFDEESYFADLERYESLGLFSSGQCRRMRDALVRFYECHNKEQRVLNHGDITTDNLLWHDGRVVTLLDFEHSVIAPPQLDLHSLVTLAFFTADTYITAGEEPGISEYLEKLFNMFEALLRRQSDCDLLLGYGILFRQHFLEAWLAEPEGEIEECEAYRKLLSLCDGSSGKVDIVLKLGGLSI